MRGEQWRCAMSWSIILQLMQIQFTEGRTNEISESLARLRPLAKEMECACSGAFSAKP